MSVFFSNLLSGARNNAQSLTNAGLSYLIPLSRRMVLGSFPHDTIGALKIQTLKGETIWVGRDFQEAQPPWIQVHDEFFWLRVLIFGDIGFAESYMLREISTPNLTAVFEFFVRNSQAINRPATAGLFPVLFGPACRSLPWRGLKNTISASRLNAAAHYSLSNDMFAAFLSPDMTYSAPMWLPASDPSSQGEALEDAQLRKLRCAVAAARIRAPDHVLEIGTGWGSFAILAARETGCRVTTVTPSGEQKRFAEGRVRAAGLGGRVAVVQADYRELDGMGPFDKIVSIEMIEHVGHDLLDGYFGCVERSLKRDGGIGYFQSITIPEGRYERYRRGEDFIKKYIFPGGHLPTVSGLVSSINRGSKGRLVVEEIKSVGMHYPKALRCWNANFQKGFEDEIVPALLRTDPEMTKVDMDIFRRKWEVSPTSVVAFPFPACVELWRLTSWYGTVLFLLLRGGLQHQVTRRRCHYGRSRKLHSTSQRRVASWENCKRGSRLAARSEEASHGIFEHGTSCLILEPYRY